MNDIDFILAALLGRKVYDRSSGVFRVFDEAGSLIEGGDAMLQGTHGALLRGALVLDQYIGKGGGEIGALDDEEEHGVARRRGQEGVIAALLVAICTSGVLDGDVDMTIRFN